MIDAREFKRRWEDFRRSDALADVTRPFPLSSLADVKLPPDSRAFLVEAGLPKEAAPYLNFGPPKMGTLPRVSSVWLQTASFDRYRIVGSNGSGDPVCIDEEAGGEVVYLNHDNRFQRVVMASSIASLAECLLLFRDFLEEAGGAAEAIEPALFQPLVARIRAIDEAVAGAEGYWQREFSCFQE